LISYDRSYEKSSEQSDKYYTCSGKYLNFNRLQLLIAKMIRAIVSLWNVGLFQYGTGMPSLIGEKHIGMASLYRSQKKREQRDTRVFS
jgi:hypothetical protein